MYRREAIPVVSTIVLSLLASSTSGKSADTKLPINQIADTAHGDRFDMSDYQMAGSNGGRGGLPEVRLWLRKTMMGRLKEGRHSWNYPQTSPPDDMHYSSWAFWKFGVSDALLQLISEQATDASHAAPHLGQYFSTLTNSGLTAWSDRSDPHTGLELDITDTVPITESCRSDHYITYGISDELCFRGNARFLLTVDKQRHLVVTPISSSLPPNDARNLQRGIESLDGHPLWSFPDNSSDAGSVQLIAEFILARNPGKLKTATPIK